MILFKVNFKNVFVSLFLLIISLSMDAQTVSIGNGSYTTSFPGTDTAGRNGYPSGSPQLSGNAIGKPVPTNDWWSKLVKENHADNMFNYPMTLKTTNTGLVVTYIPWGVIGDSQPLKVGLTGLNTNKATVSDYSDWTVSMNWKDSSHELMATSGIAMPFIYFEKESNDEVSIEVNSGTVTISAELLIIENASHGADFIFYAPTGSTWSQSGKKYTSTLNNKTYWSMAMLPQNGSSITTIANEYKKYAYVFPVNTEVNWTNNENNGTVQTVFTTTTETKEGSNNTILLGLLPHQWNNLSNNSATPKGYTYSSVRGDIKMLDGNTFTVENTFSGILPTMPYLANYSDGFDPSELTAKISQIKNDGLAEWTDSYNEGQVMNRLIQTARIADQMGDIEACDKITKTIKERLEDWLTYQSGEVAFLFYYNSNWTTLLGYPAGHGQDSNLNDHHFHWGYFIHAAAFMEQFEPGWANKWGEFINYLIRDAASPNRDDEKFPFLRNFSPYAGHCWANGFATFPQGNDQESTSESMQFNSSLIHWGTITDNDEIRDLGIYLYTTEQTAVEEYWFDMHERNFKQDQQYGMVSRVWGNSYDNGTFWTADITASYGIELYPMHAGSLYLGQNLDYLQKIWGELQSNTGILSTNDKNPNLWHDTIWKYLSFLDPKKAIELYNSYPNRVMKFGVSDAQTYHWLHAMNALGNLKNEITADYPIAAVFEKNGNKTYVAHNYTNNQLTVTFSDGYELTVPSNKMATNKDTDVNGILSSDFNQAHTNGSVNLTVETSGDNITKVEFHKEGVLLGEDTTPPYNFKATSLPLGNHGFFAKVYSGDKFNVTNTINITVGEQVPYSGTPASIPGTFEAGHYDKFEGGKGQGITYVDVSTFNEGNFRANEAVDTETVNGEGDTIGWISSGEWTEYTVDVATAGNYNLTFRYASGNPNGGGPFNLEINDQKITSEIYVNSTSIRNWSTFANKTINNIPLNKGRQTLRISFSSGEFNLGKLTFTYSSALDYEPPYSNAGENISVLLPATTATLNGSASTGPNEEVLYYEWTQIYGPSVIAFSNKNIKSTSISNLEEGIYKCKLSVGYNNYISTSEVLVIVTTDGNTKPAIVINTPTKNNTFKEGTNITITTTASDLDGHITKVEFFNKEVKLGEDTNAPYSYIWAGAEIGNHVLTAKVTDNLGAYSTSEQVDISVDEVKKCSETSSRATQGSFSVGVEATFETIGDNVDITFKLLDTNRLGVVAYLWQQTPFKESKMDELPGNTFSKTISGVSIGETIHYACKFAYAGGLSVTKYFSYKVGTSCESTPKDSDGDGVNNSSDNCPNTPANTAVDITGCSLNNDFNLPTNNFTITVQGESCYGKENGSISLTAIENHEYTAYLNGDSYPFVNNKATIENLADGNYNLCVNVVGKNYEQCYSIDIDSGTNLAAKFTDKDNTTIINIEQGTAPYNIHINGEKIMSTYNKQITVPVNNGDLLEVNSSISCEGKYHRKINLYSNIRIYPNPTKGTVILDLPSSEQPVLIEVFAAYSKVIFTEKQKIVGNITQLDFSKYSPGVYFIKVHLDKVITLKIVKQ